MQAACQSMFRCSAAAARFRSGSVTGIGSVRQQYFSIVRMQMAHRPYKFRELWSVEAAVLYGEVHENHFGLLSRYGNIKIIFLCAERVRR